MSAGGFPETPKGSPGGIEAAADQLTEAAESLEQASSALGKTAGGQSGITWSGPAEGRFTGAAGGMSAVSRGAESALRTCARAARQYAHALAAAKKIIERERTEYEDALQAEAAAGNMMRVLSREMYMAEPDQRSGFEDSIAGARNDMISAGDRARDALVRARKARQEFDEAERTAIGQLEGTAPGSASGFGPAPTPASSPGMPYAGPGAPFATSGTGGLGSQGGGFGIPPGGLSPFTGAVSKDQLGDLDPFANNRWDDLHGQTEVDDMTIAITSLASFGAAGPIEALASRGAGAARGWLASRAATRAGMSVEEKAAAQIEARAANIEKTGDLLGTAGVPYGGEAGKIAAYFSRAEVRQLWRTYYEHARSAIAKRINPHLATLRVAAELEKAQFRHLPQGTIEEILKHPSRPPIVR